MKVKKSTLEKYQSKDNMDFKAKKLNSDCLEISSILENINRDVLSNFVCKKINFIAIYNRKNYSNIGMSCEKVLLTELRSDSFDGFIDHIWVNNSIRFDSLNLVAGDVISFEATVGTYTGMKLETKYRLHKIRFIKKVIVE